MDQARAKVLAGRYITRGVRLPSFRLARKSSLIVTLLLCFIWLSWKEIHVHAATLQCRCFPGEDCWPSTLEWSNLNRSVDGRLVATHLPGSVCHEPNYDAEACKALQDEWFDPEPHYSSSASIMSPWFTNNSCEPFSSQSLPCTLGNHVSYSVNVSKVAHVTKTMDFAKKNNIRLVIRNTGHDYNGKSTGAGALAIWTHHLKDLQVQEWSNRYYSGKVMKMGAGVQAGEAYQLANVTGLHIVGGECPTVGLAGGYTAGGGHSQLASKYGLAADQVVQWEVIDGTGDLKVANPYHNSDLYWALSGGGGGTYGVVWSMTVKAHPQIPVSGFNLTFASADISQDTYFKAIEKWHKLLPSVVDKGATAVFTFTNASFSVAPITAPGVSVDDLKELFTPYTDYLSNAGINYTAEYHQFDNFLDQHNAMQFYVPVNVDQYGGWLIPRDTVSKKSGKLVDADRYITQHGGTVTGVALNVSPSVIGKVDNAVLPAWRDTLIHYVISTPWSYDVPRSQMYSAQEQMTNDFIPKLKALAPSSGAYLNEDDFRMSNFQQALYGKNYQKLKSIKQKYDPDGLFWALQAVGSEGWAQREDGRLCQTGRS